MIIALIITSGVCVIALLAFLFYKGKPSYTCSHDWDEAHHSRSAYFDYFIYICKKCGCIKKRKI